METVIDRRAPANWWLLVVFLVVVMGVGGAIGFVNIPGSWYAALTKPPFNPPNWVFAPVWTILYVLIAIAGWRTFNRDRTGAPMILWVVQMLLNWAWSPVWFSLHAPWPALAIIIALWLVIIAFIAVSWRRDLVSAWLFVPYALWVSFATVLNASIAWLN